MNISEYDKEKNVSDERLQAYKKVYKSLYEEDFEDLYEVDEQEEIKDTRE